MMVTSCSKKECNAEHSDNDVFAFRYCKLHFRGVLVQGLLPRMLHLLFEIRISRPGRSEAPGIAVGAPVLFSGLSISGCVDNWFF